MKLTMFKWFQRPWEQAREGLKSDLERIEKFVNRWQGQTFDNGNKLKLNTLGLNTPDDPPEYLTTNDASGMEWDKVNVATGVRERLPLVHFAQASRSGVILGRHSAGAGSYEEISIGPGISIGGGTASGSASDYVAMSAGGPSPVYPLDDGNGSFIYIPYTP